MCQSLAREDGEHEDDLFGTVALDGIQRIRGIVYAERDGVKLLADLYLPEKVTTAVPTVLMIHGGGWMMGTRWSMGHHANPLARAGYAVVNIDYRFAPRYKHPAQIDDCREAWAWICRHADEYHFDRTRLAVYGYSAGGHLACLLGLSSIDPTEAFPRPRAIVAGGAVCDFDWLPEESRALAYFLGGSRSEVPDAYRQASPTTHVTRDDPPIFLFHGADDQVVPVSSPRRMLAAAHDAGLRVELSVRPAAGHVETFLASEPPREAIQFLNDALNGQPDRRESGRDRKAPIEADRSTGSSKDK